MPYFSIVMNVKKKQSTTSWSLKIENLFPSAGLFGGGDDTSSYASAAEDATSLGAGSGSGGPGPNAPSSGGQFDYQQLSASTTTHGDSSSGERLLCVDNMQKIVHCSIFPRSCAEAME